MFILIYIILGVLALTVEGQSQFTTSEDGSVSLFAPKKLKLRSSVTSASNPTFTINGDLLVTGSVGIDGIEDLLQYIEDNCVLKDGNGDVYITGDLTVQGTVS